MAYLLIFFATVGALVGFRSLEHTTVERAHYSTVVQAGTLDGTQFVRFAYAMEQYIETHPSASGSLAPSSAAGAYTTSFLDEVTAWVSPPGVEPRTLICAGTFGPGALQAAVQVSGGDAAFGTPVSNGNDWISAEGLSGDTEEALAHPVPAGADLAFVVNMQP